MTLNFTELLNIVACASSCSNSMINTSRIAGHADERTTIKNYLFDTNNEEETKKAILNALGDNPESRSL